MRKGPKDPYLHSLSSRFIFLAIPSIHKLATIFPVSKHIFSMKKWFSKFILVEFKPQLRKWLFMFMNGSYASIRSNWSYVLLWQHSRNSSRVSDWKMNSWSELIRAEIFRRVMRLIRFPPTVDQTALSLMASKVFQPLHPPSFSSSSFTFELVPSFSSQLCLL